MRKRQELEPSCCAFGGLTEEVHVLEQECPIQQELGKRSLANRDGSTRKECTCIYTSSFGGGVPPCEYYQGCKEVQRNKQKVWRVFCQAVKTE